MFDNYKYQQAYQKAEEILNAYGKPNKSKSFTKLCLLSMLLSFLSFTLGAMIKIIILLLAGLIFGALFFIFLFMTAIIDFQRHENEVKLVNFKRSILLQKLIPEIIKGCEIHPNEAGELAYNSKLCGIKADIYEDYGTYHFTYPNGHKVILTKVYAYKRIHTDNSHHEICNGTLICFPGVLSHPIEAPVYIFYNQEQYIIDRKRRINLPTSNLHRGLNVISSFSEGEVFKSHISIPNEKFKQYYIPFARNYDDGVKCLTEDRVEKLIQLHEAFDKWFSISYIGQDVYVLVKPEIDFIVGKVSEPVICEDLFESFYSLITNTDDILHYVID